MNEYFWFRQICGGLWIHRHGVGWYKANRRHYEQCLANPRLYSLIESENHAGSWELRLLVLFSLISATGFLLAMLMGGV